MSHGEQLNFDFDEKSGSPDREGALFELKPQAMRRAVLGWMAARHPTGLALSVPTRISRYQADAAAFWSIPSHEARMRPVRTMIVEVRCGRGQCWPDCSEKAGVLESLRREKAELRRIEAVIRREEPGLRDSDNLFDEFESWSYERSSNQEYHRCRRRIEKHEHALYNGSRFERIRAACVADELYLAVPAGAVHPHEVADGWGLLFVRSGFEVEEVVRPFNWDCDEMRRLHLIQNIAGQARDSVLFANGIRLSAEGSVGFTPMPHRRRAKIVR